MSKSISLKNLLSFDWIYQFQKIIQDETQLILQDYFPGQSPQEWFKEYFHTDSQLWNKILCFRLMGKLRDPPLMEILGPEIEKHFGKTHLFLGPHFGLRAHSSTIAHHSIEDLDSCLQLPSSLYGWIPLNVEPSREVFPGDVVLADAHSFRHLLNKEIMSFYFQFLPESEVVQLDSRHQRHFARDFKDLSQRCALMLLSLGDTKGAARLLKRSDSDLKYSWVVQALKLGVEGELSKNANALYDPIRAYGWLELDNLVFQQKHSLMGLIKIGIKKIWRALPESIRSPIRKTLFSILRPLLKKPLPPRPVLGP